MGIKNIFLTCYLAFFSCSLLFAQKDTGILGCSVFHRAIILKVDPGLIAFNANPVGEYGGCIQYDVTDRLALYVGGGYNIAAVAASIDAPRTSLPGYSVSQYTGYTIRTGAYLFYKKHRFISAQLFFRAWQTAPDYAFNDGGDSFAYIVDPLGAMHEGPDEEQYVLNTSSATVLDLSILYGRQIIGKRTHIFFEWYAGIGARVKTITITQIGDVDYGGAFTSNPLPSDTYQSYYPEIKLGFQVGYKL